MADTTNADPPAQSNSETLFAEARRLMHEARPLLTFAQGGDAGPLPLSERGDHLSPHELAQRRMRAERAEPKLRIARDAIEMSLLGDPRILFEPNVLDVFDDLYEIVNRGFASATLDLDDNGGGIEGDVFVEAVGIITRPQFFLDLGQDNERRRLLDEVAKRKRPGSH
jgi:hypothetical protein